MLNKLGVLLLASANVWAADTLLWEPGKVVAIEEVSTPAKQPDASCRSVQRGATPPPQCRAANLAAEHYWRVTVDVGNRRFVVRPYRAQGLLDSLGQSDRVYVDPNLTAATAVEVAISSSKAIRLRTDQGQGIPAMVDSQELLANASVPLKTAIPAAPRRSATAATYAATYKVVLLENSDFRDLEAQDSKTTEIGDGAILYSFTSDSSPTRVSSRSPVFLILAETPAAAGGNLELSRLQVGQGTRQLVYSPAKKRSASSVPIIVTQVSATVRKVSVTEPLASGAYVVLLENSDRGFLFEIR